jgi:hypothetical protein
LLSDIYTTTSKQISSTAEVGLGTTHGSFPWRLIKYVTTCASPRSVIDNIEETSLDSADHQPFQDAILFDMLLELAIDDFKPHTRTIAEGPAIMLEILQALEVVQKEVEAAASANPSEC